jgi:hypothetical protein
MRHLCRMSVPDRRSSQAGSRPLLNPAVLIAIAIAVAWLWTCWCLFPVRGWNDVRLAPVFGLKLGLPIYAGRGGPASTWMYGPLPLVLLSPATWAANAGQALQIAGGINLVILLGAIGLVCTFWPVPEAASRGVSTRVMAVALTVIILPRSMWQFLQADNTAVAFGLLSSLVLVLTRTPQGRWGAALLAAGGLLCKQTSVGVPFAQVIWLAGIEGRSAARDHVLRLLATGGGWAIALLLWQDPEATWFHLIAIPAALPWTGEPWRLLWNFAPFLALQIGLPVIVWFWLRREHFHRSLALPMLAWLCAWLPGLAGLLKIGGSINNLQSFPLWLPPALVVAGFALGTKIGARQTRLAAATLVLCVFTWRIALAPATPWWPSLQLYREAADLAEARPGQIWYPWHPLVTIFSEHRLYHVEDGLYVRILSGKPPTVDEMKRFLPARLSVIALPRNAQDFGVARSLRPKGGREEDSGLWTLYCWPAPAARN